jgi:O-antigen ligase
MNTVGIITSYVGVITFIFFKRNITKNYHIYNIGSFIVFFILIFISESRTALLVYIMIGIYIIFFQQRKLSIKNFMVLLLAISITIPFIGKIDAFLRKYFLQKWETADISSGRIEMWTFFSKAENEFVKLLGNGNQLVGNYFKVTDVHNIFFQTLVQFGLISLIVLVVFVIVLGRQIYLEKRIESLFFIWLLLIGMFENVLIFNKNIVFIVLPFLVLATLFSIKDKKGEI